MSLYGVAGFPLMDGIPRGEAFVNFMRSRDGAPASGSAASTAPPVGLTPGAFDDNASSTLVSQKTTDLGGGIKQIDVTRRFSDGSTRTATRTVFPDGSAKVSAERRSMPDANGFEKVRVFETTIAPDGTREVNMRIFRVPAGMKPDWNAAGAQQFMLHSDTKTIPPGMIWSDVPSDLPSETTTDTSDPPQDAVVPSGRPVVPLAT